MEDEVLEQVKEVETAAAAAEGVEGDVEAGKTEEKMLAQSEVNELVGRARKEGREGAMKALMEQYGFESEEQMGEVIGKGLKYDALEADHETMEAALTHAMEDNALLKSGVLEDRWNDIKLILGGNGLEVTEENIEKMIPTHPEWREVKGEDEPTIKRFGASASAYNKPSEDEKEYAMKLFFKAE